MRQTRAYTTAMPRTDCPLDHLRLRNTGRGTFHITGRAVTDPDVLAEMAIPDHETAIEVDIMKVTYPHALSPEIR